ncbi:hypothetical protein LCGC14_1608700 [marine sediment metagenome]|uniref:AraC-type arabinose-binding/dimerisation domain-containing protein n=1 Tax=marine sediment metagenome TaxID=412755 RepID=A0A0F9L985_9ZZZZ
MKPYRKFENFQIRWKEALGRLECPYLYRWTFLFFGFSLRIHHWLRSDDRRFFHDHGCNLISIILKGRYKNVTPNGTKEVKAGSIWFAKAEARHYLDIPKEGAWTLLVCGRKYRNWGFWDKENHMLRPLEYFHRYGIIQDENY